MNFDSGVLQVAIEDIIPNRFQPRLAFEDASLNELAASIKQHGIIQPLVLRKVGEKYEIIAGERRYKAATMAGLASVPAVIAKIDDRTSAEVAIAENVQRRELTAIEEARSYQNLLSQGYMSEEQLARKMGLTPSAIANKLKLLALSNEVQDAILENKISERHGRALLSVKQIDEQIKWLNRIINDRLTVRQLDELLKKEYKGGTMNAGVDINQIKQNATDINPVSGNASNQLNSFNMGPIELGEQRQSGFFNNLESEAANMQMTENNPFDTHITPVVPPSTPEPIVQVNNIPLEPITASAVASASLPQINDIDMLDTLDAEPPKVSGDITFARNKINNLISELRSNNINAELVEKYENGEIIYSIII